MNYPDLNFKNSSFFILECAGHIIQSSVIMNAKRNPNFSTTVKFLDIELPEQEIYCPPLTIRVVDCRSFGRFTLVGTHVINSIHKFLYQPVTKRDREAAERKKLKALAAQRMATKPPGKLKQKYFFPKFFPPEISAFVPSGLCKYLRTKFV